MYDIPQRRASADINFYRGWNAYKKGFGDPTGNFWLGNDAIHKLTDKVSERNGLCYFKLVINFKKITLYFKAFQYIYIHMCVCVSVCK